MKEKYFTEQDVKIIKDYVVTRIVKPEPFSFRVVTKSSKRYLFNKELKCSFGVEDIDFKLIFQSNDRKECEKKVYEANNL